MFVKKLCNIALVAMFALGVLLAPAVHRATCSCEDHHACPAQSHEDHHPPVKHDSNRCPICQLAFTPVIASAPVVVPVITGPVLENASGAVVAPITHKDHRLPFSRGPPV